MNSNHYNPRLPRYQYSGTRSFNPDPSGQSFTYPKGDIRKLAAQNGPGEKGLILQAATEAKIQKWALRFCGLVVIFCIVKFIITLL